MKPALSVIFFTVSSGAGLGLLVILALLVLTNDAPPNTHLPLLALGMALTVAGLISSTLHLANPKNAWRAFSRFSTSWLSREGVLALALFPIAGLFAVAANAFTALLLAAVALAVLLCTGMIYACLKTVPRWHTPLTPASYVAIGLYSGALLALPVLVGLGADIGGKAYIVLALLAIALAIKLAYFFKFGPAEAQHTIQQALPLGKEPKTIALLDLGHTHGNFLTQEFFFVLARAQARRVRLVALVLGFVIPAVALTSSGLSVRALTFAAVCCLLGLLAERWLFFAEAKHVVRLYHGARQV